MTPTLLLWADSQVGKTSLLATAFYGNHYWLKRIDRQKSARALSGTLFPHWQRLQTGRPVLPTSEESIALNLITTTEQPLRIMDIKGGQTRDMKESTMDRLEQATAMLFLLEWNPKPPAQQVLSIRAAVEHLGRRPCGLVFTKCERTFSRTDAIWSNPNWWKNNVSPELAQLQPLFGDAVWPTSAYGYDQQNDLPAWIPGEYGDLLPFHVKPEGVALPFEWGLDAMGFK